MNMQDYAWFLQVSIPSSSGHQLRPDNRIPAGIARDTELPEFQSLLHQGIS